MITRPCDHCQEPYQAEQRYLNRGQGKFCSRRCSGLFKAAQLPPPELNVECAFCHTKFHLSQSRQNKSNSGLYFCSKEHQTEGFRAKLLNPGPKPQYVTKTCIRCNKKRQAWYDTCRPCELEITIEKWLAGDNSVTINNGASKDTKKFVKKYLIETRGDKCEACGWDQKAPDGRSIIQMDHIDGNSQNNLIENLRLLCPNHHAMTETYGSLNKGSGRAHRRKFG